MVKRTQRARTTSTKYREAFHDIARANGCRATALGYDRFLSRWFARVEKDGIVFYGSGPSAQRAIFDSLATFFVCR